MKELKCIQAGLPNAAHIRKALGISVECMADVVSRTPSFWRKLEAGSTNCTVLTAQLAARYLCCTVDDLSNGVSESRLAEIRASFTQRVADEARVAFERAVAS